MIDLTPRDTHPWVAEGVGKIRFGVSIYPQPPDWRHFLDLVQQMETAGFDGYFSYDHPGSNADCWTALSALAVVTSTIRLGLAVDCIYYRPPYLLARQAADVDRLSNGRLVLGLGIGHVKSEFREMGIRFPSTAERLSGMDETIAILRGLFTGEPFAFDGAQWSVDSPGTFLPPVQQPRIPILLAGGGEKVTLRQVAQYADASNMGAHGSIGMAVTDDDIRRKFRVLADYCAEFGRPANSVLRSQFTMPLVLGRNQTEIDQKLKQWPAETVASWGDAMVATTPEHAIAFYRAQAQLGYQYFIANVLGGDDDTIDLLATRVMPAVMGA
ncbi:MAG: LLM class flavin-dependent oxidoreductase [Thermomicrobiales bacterium]|nr:LLM class flavin-dependent oxidoreductase [Thermomicrobiales bacterium]